MEIIVIILVAVAAVVVGTHAARRRRWQRAALRLGLHVNHGGLLGSPMIAGTFDGFKVLVRLAAALPAGASGTPRGRASQDTIFRLTFSASLQADVHFCPARSAEDVKAAIGLRPIDTGEEAFDDIVLARGRSEVGVRRFLKPARRRALLRFFGTHGGLRHVDSNVIVSREPGCLGEDAIVAAVRELAELARCLVHSRDEAAPGERDLQPGRAMDAPIPEAPDPIATVWEPVAEEAVPAPAPEMTVAAAAAPEAAEPAAGVDAEAVCAALFDPKLSTYDTRRVFERDCRGKEVAWQGTLAAVEQSSYDPELGEEPGVKATFEIGAVVSALGDSERVQAAVRFAPDAVAALEARRGARVAFLGTLAGVDGVSRTVYVGDGRLSP